MKHTKNPVHRPAYFRLAGLLTIFTVVMLGGTARVSASCDSNTPTFQEWVYCPCLEGYVARFNCTFTGTDTGCESTFQNCPPSDFCSVLSAGGCTQLSALRPEGRQRLAPELIRRQLGLQASNEPLGCEREFTSWLDSFNRPHNARRLYTTNRREGI
jgi:hypothetical protein